jgi:hypothetical protein
MPAVTLTGMTGAPRSLSDALFLTHAPKTPFMSKIRVGQTVNQPKHTYKVGREGTPVTSATPDNSPPNPAGGKNPEYEVDTRVGFFESMPRVGKFAKHRVIVGQTAAQQAGKNAGSGTPHLTMARVQHLERIKFGMEKIALADSDSSPETAVQADMFRGAGSWISNTAQSDLPVDSNVRTPSNQLYTGTLANFTEAQLNTLLQARWASGGYTTELLGLVGAALKTQIGTFNRRVPQTASYDTVIRYGSQDLARAVIYGVDIYEGDFEKVEFITDFYMPYSQRGYLLDMAHPEKLPFGPGMDEEKLGADGGGDALVLYAMFAWHPGDPRAHGKIKPSDEA